MRSILVLFLCLFVAGERSIVAEGQASPHVKYIVIEQGAVTPVHLRPGYTTSVRAPDDVSSVVVGNPLAFKAEHSSAEPRLVFVKPIATRAAESNLLITTKANEEISLHLISNGLAGPPAQVDFLVEFRRRQSLLITEPDGSSLFVPQTKSIRQQPATEQANEMVDPVAHVLALQEAIASPTWQGIALQVSVGQSSEVDHRMCLGFSVLNHSRQTIELLPPQIVLSGHSAKGKEIKAEPIGILDYRMTRKRLQQGERADGVVVFEPPTFKESAEKIELQLAESGKVDRPIRVPIPFVATMAGVDHEPK